MITKNGAKYRKYIVSFRKYFIWAEYKTEEDAQMDSNIKQGPTWSTIRAAYIMLYLESIAIFGAWMKSWDQKVSHPLSFLQQKEMSN